MGLREPPSVLPISIEETDSTEVTPQACTVSRSAKCLHVSGLLPALVTGGAIMRVNLVADSVHNIEHCSQQSNYLGCGFPVS